MSYYVSTFMGLLESNNEKHIKISQLYTVTMTDIVYDISEYECTRHGFKWSIPETLSLQREYELLQLPIELIAYRHRRTHNAIRERVELENFEQVSVSDYDPPSILSNPILKVYQYIALAGISIISIFFTFYSIG